MTVPFAKKSGKGTVKIVGQRARPTVPFAKKRQRHGQKWRLRVVRDRAFCKKTAKARSKSAVEGRARPCLLRKSAKGTVKIAGAGGETDRAFCKKTTKARSKSAVEGRARPCLLQKNVKGTVNGHLHPRIGAFGAGRSRPDGRRLVNKEGAPAGRLLW